MPIPIQTPQSSTCANTALMLALLAGVWAPAAPGHAASAAAAHAANAADSATAPRASLAAESDHAPGVLRLTAGSSRLIPLERPVERLSVAHPGVADVILLGPQELYVLGRGLGMTNILLWNRGGSVTTLEVDVQMDVGPLRRQLARLLPDEPELRVQPTADSVALTGTVGSVVKAEQAVALAQGHLRALARLGQPAGPVAAGPAGGAHGAGTAAGTGAGAGAQAMPRSMGSSMGSSMASSMGGGMGGAGGSGMTAPQVINLLSIRQPHQVMLEVKVAEVSRNLLDQFGISLSLSRTSGSMTYGLLTQALQDVFGRLMISGRNGSVTVDAKAQDALVRILAEPNIVALSGQEGSFLAGGKVFIPVARDSAEGRSTITLEEKEYGVGLRFTPQVLDGDVIQLRVAPEVSELSKTGSPFLTTGGSSTVLPSFTTRRAATTVQLRDGQSLAIAGLIKNNVTEAVNRFPFLSDIPVLGALFRSTEFQTDRSELLFVITPRLVKALPATAALPTDSHQAPGRVEGLLGGALEAAPSAPRGVPALPNPLEEPLDEPSN